MKFITRNKDIASVFAITAGILIVHLVAMQFTTEVNWGLHDFILMGMLISVTGLLVVTVAKKDKKATHRAVLILALLAALFVIWVHLAVGIVDTWPLAGN